MDNFMHFSGSNANNLQDFSMDIDNNHSQLTNPTYGDHHHQVQTHQFFPPYSNPLEQTSSMMDPHPVYSSEYFPQIPVTQSTSEFGYVVGYPCLSQERGVVVGYPCLSQERGVNFFPPHVTKMARINRKKAMIRSRKNSIPNFTPNEMAVSKRSLMVNMKNNVQMSDIKMPDIRRGFYRYYTFDNKKIRVLCVKHLKKSDIGPLGRIVLPKREAEVNLPVLTRKEGILVVVRDVFSLESWCFKYRYWDNKETRMYVLEHTGEFVKQKQAEIEDSLTIYEDESKNLYYALRKSGNQNVGSSSGMNHKEDVTFDYTEREEEDFIAMLTEYLNDPNVKDLMKVDFTVALPNHQASSSLPPVDHPAMGSSDD